MKWTSAVLAIFMEFHEFELLDAIKKGDLTPYDYDGNKVLDKNMFTKEGLSKFLFRTSEFNVFKKKREEDLAIEEQILITKSKTRKETEGKSATNYFRRKGDIWEIGYEGKETAIKYLAGLHYIAFLLDMASSHKMKDDYISAQDFYYVVNPPEEKAHDNRENKYDYDGNNFSKTMSHKVKVINPSGKTKRELGEVLRELIESKKKADTKLESSQIQAAIDSMMSEIKDLDSSNVRIKDNIKKALDRAYARLKKMGMKELAIYLEKHIFTNDKRGFFYSGLSFDVDFGK